MFRKNPETVWPQAYHDLETAGTPVLLSPAKPVLHGKKLLLQKRHFWARLKFSAVQMFLKECFLVKRGNDWAAWSQ